MKIKNPFFFINLLFGTLFFLFSTASTAQEKRDEGFRSPLDIPLYLAGNFGELRSNHFHTGIDIKTQGSEGKAVYSIKEGYISRIKISAGGYGKAIYVRHPNGYTSVYAHLKKGSPRIEAYIQNKQYQKESFTLELFPKKNELALEYGELIAYSGNTGSSGGPHLHFEIRETATEKALNPLLFGFKIQDNIRPIIKGVRFYTLDEDSYVSDYPGSAVGFAVEGKFGDYHLKAGQRIEAFGNIGMAIHTFDLLNGYPNKCGVYKIELKVDSELVFTQEFDKLTFSEGRYINTYLDYPLFKSGRKYYHKQFIGENNKLSIYKHQENKGVLTFDDAKIHQIEYRVYDSYGNVSKLGFTLLGLAQIPTPLMREKQEKPMAEFRIEGPNYFKDENLSIEIPSMALYDNMDFNYTIRAQQKNTFGQIYVIGDLEIPLQKSFTLRFKHNSIPAKYYSKAIVVMVEEKGNLSSMGGKLIDGKMEVKSRFFGAYSLAVDTVAPKIRSVNIAANKDMSTYNTFSLKISDQLSGIKSYRGTIDGKWILMEYDKKKDTLHYRFDDDKVAKGKHQFLLIVKDAKNNESRYEASFIR